MEEPKLLWGKIGDEVVETGEAALGPGHENPLEGLAERRIGVGELQIGDADLRIECDRAVDRHSDLVGNQAPMELLIAAVHMPSTHNSTAVLFSMALT